MDREKLRVDMLRRLEAFRQSSRRGETEWLNLRGLEILPDPLLEKAIFRLQEGMSDASCCPICHYLHGKTVKLTRKRSKGAQHVTDGICEICGFSEESA